MLINSSSIITTSHLSFAYREKLVIKELSLDIPSGSIFGFLGPNGAGKSTTIKILLGLLQVKAGSIHIFGKEFNHNRLEILPDIGAMVEVPSLYEHLSGRRNLEITCRLRSLPLSRIDEVLQIVSMESDAHRKVRQYSTGMKQRLSLAIALLGKPKLLILDEPINGLDPSGIIEIRNLLVKLNREEACTIFLSSHLLDEIEKICTHLGVIQNGILLFQGVTSDLLHQYNRKVSYRMETNDPVNAQEILKEEAVNLVDHFLMIPYDRKEKIAAIIRKLTDAGIDIYSVEKVQSDLESSFLEILREGGKN